jgi:hypothetical protein
MRYMELPHADDERVVRIRPDRIDVIDETEEYSRDEGGREVTPLRSITLVYIQGRRNPWRVTTPAEEIERMHSTWVQTGRFSEEEEDEDEYR